MQQNELSYIALELTKIANPSGSLIVYETYKEILTKLENENTENEWAKQLYAANDQITMLKEQVKENGMPKAVIERLKQYIKENEGDMEPRISTYLTNELNKWL